MQVIIVIIVFQIRRCQDADNQGTTKEAIKTKVDKVLNPVGSIFCICLQIVSRVEGKSLLLIK
jgi:F420-0:gamma-glutamyl ligase